MPDLWDGVDRFVDAFSKVGQLADLRMELHEANNLDARKCGNCFWWMKSRLCPREHNVNGWNEGPNCESPACNKFQLTEFTKKLKTGRLKEIESKFDALEHPRQPGR